jgi:hypothetical protein
VSVAPVKIPSFFLSPGFSTGFLIFTRVRPTRQRPAQPVAHFPYFLKDNITIGQSQDDKLASIHLSTISLLSADR